MAPFDEHNEEDEMHDFTMDTRKLRKVKKKGASSAIPPKGKSELPPIPPRRPPR